MNQTQRLIRILNEMLKYEIRPDMIAMYMKQIKDLEAV